MLSQNIRPYYLFRYIGNYLTHQAGFTWWRMTIRNEVDRQGLDADRPKFLLLRIFTYISTMRYHPWG